MKIIARKSIALTALLGVLALGGAACEAEVDGNGEGIEGDVNLDEEGGEGEGDG